MQVVPNVHQIPVVYKGRPLNLYLITSGKQSMLIDTGFADTPAKDILPYFASIGFDPRSLTYILLTHPDVDHVGGVYAMRDMAPQVRFLCGTQDREQIQTPEAMGRIRARAHYHFHGLGPDDAKLAAFIQSCGGAGNKLDFFRTFDGGETMMLGELTLRILHLPGHSMGHLGVYLADSNTAIIGDAVHGTANRFLDGKAAFACTYMYIDAYLGTIDQLQAMKLTNLFSCHWPDCRSTAAIDGFLNQSRAYAQHSESVILRAVQAAGARGLTLKDVCICAKPGLGDWPSEKDTETRSMACGHLQRLADVGLIRATDEIPTRYIAQSPWVGLR